MPDEEAVMGAPGVLAELDGLREQLRRIEDQERIRALIDDYGRSLDAMSFTEEWARSLFTQDVELRFPVGGHDGLAGMAEFTAEFMYRWARTHHHAAGHEIALAGDRADIGWSILATHVHRDDDGGPRAAGGRPAVPLGTSAEPFRLGGYFHGEAHRTPAGWRLRRLGLRVLWTTGSPVAAVPLPALG